MGYYTKYDISDNPETVQEAIQEKSQYSFYYGRTDEVKWYNWQKDCLEVSKDFPNLVISIEGIGEEEGDHWKAYIKDGKIQMTKALVTFEAFDEAKLK